MLTCCVHLLWLICMQGGTVYAPMYYWVDLFAVHQNFKGDFKGEVEG